MFMFMLMPIHMYMFMLMHMIENRQNFKVFRFSHLYFFLVYKVEIYEVISDESAGRVGYYLIRTESE